MNEKETILIVSVGGSPNPIIKSIEHYKPQLVIFYASQDTIKFLVNIENETKTNFKAKTILLDDPNNLQDCFEKALKINEYITDYKIENNDIIIDYTGGTKNMTASIVLATIEQGFTYSYVGGQNRTKGGVGIVKDGDEEIFTVPNPWDKIAKKEKKPVIDFI